MGWQPDLTKWAKVRIALAAITLTSYDLGFEAVVGKYSLEKWLNKMEESFSFNNARQTMRKRKEGRTSYTDLIDSNHLEYLHKMFCHATQLLGNGAMLEELALAMNLQSTAVENMPLLRMNKFNLLRWFKKNTGIEKPIFQRQILTNEHKIARLCHVALIQNLHCQGKQSASSMRSGSAAFQGGKITNTYQEQHSRKKE
jgi:hypothetical protein